MPLPGSYPCDHGKMETVIICDIDGEEFAVDCKKNDYSITVYADGHFGFCLPEYCRPWIPVKRNEYQSLCIQASRYSIIRH